MRILSIAAAALLSGGLSVGGALQPRTPVAIEIDLLGSYVTSSTTTPTTPATTTLARPHWEAVGDEALGRISYPWQSNLPGWTIEFLPGRAGLLGGTWPYEKRIEIYVRDGQDANEVAFTAAHELGHAIDVTLLSGADRETWRQTRHLPPDAPWWVASGATDFASGAGDWAESFAVWQIGGRSQSRLAGQPGAAELAVMAQLAQPNRSTQEQQPR